MKRFLIGVLTTCCIVSTISANSLLFTPHHVSIDALVRSGGWLDKRTSPTFPFHIDSEGKRESVDFNDIQSLKLDDRAHPAFFEFYVYKISLEQFGSSTLNYLTSENHPVIYNRIVLFPFHSFW